MGDRKPEVGDKVIFTEKYGTTKLKGEVVGTRVDVDEFFIKYVVIKTDWIDSKKIEIDTIPTMKAIDEDA